MIRAGSFDIGDAYWATAERLRQGADFTAVFSIADNMALGAMPGAAGGGMPGAGGLLRYRHRRPDHVGVFPAHADHPLPAYGGDGAGAAWKS